MLRAAGSSLTFSGRGRSLVDWAFALSGLRPDQIAMVKLSGGVVGRWVEDLSKKPDDKPSAEPSGPVDPRKDPEKPEKPEKPKLKYEYLGEQLDVPARRLLASVAAGSVENFLALHPELLSD